MATATRADLTIWRGNDAPALVWNFPSLDFTGSAFALAVTIYRELVLSLTSDAGDLVIDTEAKTVSWTPTIEQSRSIPLGKLSRYELSRLVTDGETRTYVYGWLTGLGGDNSNV
ncbi:hypothetical protein C3941_19850 [Kaistia algarum]|uniref:hypothetical protein n=1 Tax=Kaistia algarum TaxID=2083279 RepID=UPI000CE76EB0|nr:hypothetical protein [Kaistia algarum]MCX5516247.1 hypothetical protein [Kaistia algarum]PPE78317.1 hypothetical protein C3941_19850 [Kaistia algarum]